MDESEVASDQETGVMENSGAQLGHDPYGYYTEAYKERIKEGQEDLQNSNDTEATGAAFRPPKASSEDDAEGDDEEIFGPDLTSEVIQKSPIREHRHKRRREHGLGRSRRSSTDGGEITAQDLTDTVVQKSSIHERRQKRRRKHERDQLRRDRHESIASMSRLRQNTTEQSIHFLTLRAPKQHRQPPGGLPTSMEISPYSVKSTPRFTSNRKREKLKSSLRRLAFGDSDDEMRRRANTIQQPFCGSRQSSPLTEKGVHSNRYPSPVSQFLNCSSNDFVTKSGEEYAPRGPFSKTPGLDGYNDFPLRATNGASEFHEPRRHEAKRTVLESHRLPQNQPRARNELVLWTPKNSLTPAGNHATYHAIHEQEPKPLPRYDGHLGALSRGSANYQQLSSNPSMRYPDLQSRPYQQAPPTMPVSQFQNHISSRGMSAQPYADPQLLTKYIPTAVPGTWNHANPHYFQEPNPEYKHNPSSSMFPVGGAPQFRAPLSNSYNPQPPQSGFRPESLNPTPAGSHVWRPQNSATFPTSDPVKSTTYTSATNQPDNYLHNSEQRQAPQYPAHIRDNLTPFNKAVGTDNFHNPISYPSERVNY